VPAPEQPAAPTTESAPKSKKDIKKPPAVFYLGRFQGIYLPQTGQPVTIPFPPEIVRDMDVVNRDTLCDYFKATAQQLQLMPSTVTILLADEILFVKQIETTEPKAKEEEIQAFVDSVPFEDPALTKMPAPPKTIVAVSSREYFEAFEEAFNAVDSSVDMIIPAFVMAKEVNLAQSIDANTLMLALRKAPSYRQYNLFQKEADVLPHAATPLITKEAPKDKKRLYAMVGALGVLLIVLVFVYQASSQSIKKAPLPTPTPGSAPAAAPAVPATPAASSSAQASQSAKIEYVPEKVQQATAMKDKLQALGFSDVGIIEAPTLAGAGSLAVFSTNIPAPAKQTIVTALQQIDPTIRIQDTTSSSVGLQITLTK
jgi:hypothetical protein